MIFFGPIHRSAHYQGTLTNFNSALALIVLIGVRIYWKFTL